jgi:hypothetical protein
MEMEMKAKHNGIILCDLYSSLSRIYFYLVCYVGTRTTGYRL